MRLEFDLEALEQIPVQDVVVALGGTFPKDREPGTPQYNMHCCNGNFHKEGDKKPSLTVYKGKNICKCHVCGTAGNPISVAKTMQGDFKEACKWLHDTFGIPYKSGSSYQNSRPKKFHKPKQKQIEYERFDKSLGFTHVEVRNYVDKYYQLNEQQRLKLVYTYLYRYSLTTDRKKLNGYYQKRGIINNSHTKKIGYLSESDIKIVVDKLKGLFSIEDLVRFEILHSKDHKYFPLQWRQLKECLVVPSFSIHTDLIEGMMFRPIDEESNKWFKGKEKRMSIASILKPHPFGMGYGLLSKDCDIYITEGHIDAFSLPSNYCFIAPPGVQAFEQEHLGLLKGRNIKLVFDQDESMAGQQSAFGYTVLEFLDQKLTILHDRQGVRRDIETTKRLLESQGIKISMYSHEGLRDKLLKAGVKSVEVITWDRSLGGDINDLLVNGNLNKVFTK